MQKPFAITLDPGSSRQNHTGSWRTQRPIYVDRMPPCNHACPAGEDIQHWLFLAESGNYQGAWESLVRNNPMPAVMGRVCYHTCESACNRASLDQAVNIHAVERFLGDEAIRQGWEYPPVGGVTGKRVLIVGAGPSGLSAAYHLRRLGHEVTIYDAGSRAGGMMRYGIPRYRLPREVLDAEIARMERMGVRIILNRKVEDLEAERHGFDAVFLAVGAHVSKRAYIPATDSRRILDALSVLKRIEEGEPVELGRKVIVYGGGNTAMDVARSVQRLGATEALIVYRRTREKMPAHDFELEEALDEGVEVRWLETIKAAEEGTFLVEKMTLNAGGLPEPTGKYETIQADTCVLALGQDVDLGFLERVPGLERKQGMVAVDAGMMTGCEGVFAGGDMVPAERTVTVAIGHGKLAARQIDAWLRGRPRHLGEDRPNLASFDKLNTWYYSDAPQTIQPALDKARRRFGFEEVMGGLTEETAQFEARRCLSCGNCFECDNCYGMCPDNAVIKLGPGRRFRFDYEYCKGCGICAAECPCGAIEMVPESA